MCSYLIFGSFCEFRRVNNPNKILQIETLKQKKKVKGIVTHSMRSIMDHDLLQWLKLTLFAIDSRV